MKKFPTGDDKLKNRDYLKPRRKILRGNLTPAEAAFWNLVKNGNLDGRKFRRQQSVGNYILDFYCPSEKLAIELDGEGHFTNLGFEQDSTRSSYIKSLGIRILRFENEVVFEDPERVIGIIKYNFGWNRNDGEK